MHNKDTPQEWWQITFPIKIREMRTLAESLPPIRPENTTDRHWGIFTSVVCGHKTFDAVARKEGVSRERVRQIVERVARQVSRATVSRLNEETNQYIPVYQLHGPFVPELYAHVQEPRLRNALLDIHKHGLSPFTASEKELLKIRNIGPVRLAEIKDFIHKDYKVKPPKA